MADPNNPLTGLPGFGGGVGAQSPLAGLPGFTREIASPQQILEIAQKQQVAEQLAVDNEAARIAARREAKVREMQRLRAEQGGVTGALKAGGAAFVEGVYSATGGLLSGLAGLGYAATGSEFLKDFARETSTANLLPTISAAFGLATSDQTGLRARHEYDAALAGALQERVEERQEWSMLSTVAEAAGMITGGVATGLAGGALLGGVSKAGQIAFGGSALRQAGLAGTEGLLQGAAAPFNNGGTPTQWEVLGSAAMAATLSAGLGYGVARTAQALPDNLAARVFGKPTEVLSDIKSRILGKGGKVADDALDDIARGINPEAHPGVGKDALAAKEYLDQLDSEVKLKVNKAAEAFEDTDAAASRAVQERNARIEADLKKLGKVNADNWQKIPAWARGLLNNEVIEGATMDLSRVHNQMLNGADGLESFLKVKNLKADGIRKNFAADKIDEVAAVQSTKNMVQDLRDGLRATLMEKSREVPLRQPPIVRGTGERAAIASEPDPAFWKPYKNQIATIEKTLDNADRGLAKIKDAADAYIIEDQVRRELLEQMIKLRRYARGNHPSDTPPAELLAPWATDAYQNKLVGHLADEGIWGRQGRTQATINEFWREKIFAGQYAENSITTRVGTDFDEAVRVADEDKARGILKSLDEGKASLRRDKLHDYYDAQEKMAQAVKEGYELTPQVAKAADEAIASARRAKEILTVVERNSSTVMAGVIKALNDKATGMISGTIAGSIVGGGFGGVIGAVTLPVVQATAKRLIERIAVRSASKAAAKAGGGAARAALPRLGAEYAAGISAKALGLSGAVSHEIFQTKNDIPREERFKRYEKRQEVLATVLGDPNLQQQGLAIGLGAVTQKHAALGGATGIAMLGNMRKLQERFPGRKEISLIPALGRTVVSDAELRQSEAYWEAATDPSSVFADFENGMVDPDKAAFWRELYPGMVELYRAGVLDALARIPEDAAINQSQLTQLDNLLGFNGALSPTVEKGFSDRITQATAKLAEEQPKPAPRQLNLPTAKPTFTQRMMRS